MTQHSVASLHLTRPALEALHSPSVPCRVYWTSTDSVCSRQAVRCTDACLMVRHSPAPPSPPAGPKPLPRPPQDVIWMPPPAPGLPPSLVLPMSSTRSSLCSSDGIGGAHSTGEDEAASPPSSRRRLNPPPAPGGLPLSVALSMSAMDSRQCNSDGVGGASGGERGLCSSARSDKDGRHHLHRARRVGLLDLPDELVQQVLVRLPTHDLLAVACSCRPLRAVTAAAVVGARLDWAAANEATLALNEPVDPPWTTGLPLRLSVAAAATRWEPGQLYNSPPAADHLVLFASHVPAVLRLLDTTRPHRLGLTVFPNWQPRFPKSIPIVPRALVEGTLQLAARLAPRGQLTADAWTVGQLMQSGGLPAGLRGLSVTGEAVALASIAKPLAHFLALAEPPVDALSLRSSSGPPILDLYMVSTGMWIEKPLDAVALWFQPPPRCLRQLTLTNIDVTLEAAASLAGLKHLRDLSFVCCVVQDDSLALLGPPALPCLVAASLFIGLPEGATPGTDFGLSTFLKGRELDALRLPRLPAGKAETAVALLAALPRSLICSVERPRAGVHSSTMDTGVLRKVSFRGALAVLRLAVADAGAALAVLGDGSFPALIDLQLHLQGYGGAVGCWPDRLPLVRLGLTGEEPAQAAAIEALVRAVGDAPALVQSLRLLRITTAALVPADAAAGLRQLTALRRVEVVVPLPATDSATHRANRRAYTNELAAGLRVGATVALFA